MKKFNQYRFVYLFIVVCVILAGHPGFAADTCMFQTNQDENPPLINLLMDNGAEMEHVVWHDDFDNSTDYTPQVAAEWDVLDAAQGEAWTPPVQYTKLILTDVVEKDLFFEVGTDVEGVTSGAGANVYTMATVGSELHLEIDSVTGTFQEGETVRRYKNKNQYASGTLSQIVVPETPEAPTEPVTEANGFFNDRGYGIVDHGGVWYLVKVLNDLTLDSYTNGLAADSGSTWVINGRSITLPPQSDTYENEYGVIDGAVQLRYSMNYLNWLFFAEDEGGSPLYTGDGSDLPYVSRWYYAKQAVRTVLKQTANKAKFSIHYYTNDEGATQKQPLKYALQEPLATNPMDNELTAEFHNNINGMATAIYSPLAEGLGTLGGYFQSAASHIAASYCQKLFVIVITPGYSSMDQGGAMTGSQDAPPSLADYDGDNDTGEIGEGFIKADSSVYPIPTNMNGTTYLDDVAHYLYTNDIVPYQDGFQNVMTYTIGFMGDRISNLFLINTSNNGNGNPNLYDTTHSDYGIYHFTAESPAGLAEALQAAIDSIFSRTSTFTAPVVPVTRTTSSNRVYMSLFKPKEGLFWEGNVVKFGIDDNQQIVDADGNAATWPNGAIKEDAKPFWSTQTWSGYDSEATNDMDNRTGYSNSRKIYTYMGTNTDLTDSDNAFVTTNSSLTSEYFGNPTYSADAIIKYVRGGDPLDSDNDGLVDENREIITGDALHSEPYVYTYNYSDNTAKTLVFYGANDGMIHAVMDATDPDVNTDNDEVNYGTEHWAFVPPHHLPRLKNFLEGTSHIDFIDSSPRAYFKDVDKDGFVDTSDGDQIVLICGERKGGSNYVALDVTDPDTPKYLWRIGNGRPDYAIIELTDVNGTWLDDDYAVQFGSDASPSGGIEGYVQLDGTPTGNVISYDYVWGNLDVGRRVFAWRSGAPLDTVYGTISRVFPAPPETTIWYLGETWSEPQFGLVKTSDNDTTGTPVFFVGGGYHETNAYGKAVLAINVLTGAVVKTWYYSSYADMDYSIPSNVKVIDENNNGFVDKLYVGDMGGQMWRIGQFELDSEGEALDFPDSNENINTWTAHVLFRSDSTYTRKFFYPPSITLERGYDLVLMGTGDRENACSKPGDAIDARDPTDTNSSDRIYVVKDYHTSDTWTESDLVDVTDETDPVPDLEDPAGDVDGDFNYDQGWYIRLVDEFGDAVGEKVLAEGTTFFGVFYITTFTPTTDPCLPGGEGRLYGLEYKTGAAVVNFDEETSEPERYTTIGGGIPSKAVTVITELGEKLFISVGSTNPDENSDSIEAGIIALDPLSPAINFFYLWWKEL